MATAQAMSSLSAGTRSASLRAATTACALPLAARPLRGEAGLS
jgi:hypothetical protein